MMQEPEAFSKAPSASPNRSENPSAGASAKYLGKREEELMKKRRRQTGKWTATSRRSCLRWLTSSGNSATKEHSSSMTPEREGLRLVDRAACSHLSLSSLEPALAGEIRREPVHAESERELAAVVQVM